MAITYPLDYRDINPVIRIAHRLAGPLNIPPRIIFDHELVLITAGVVEFIAEGQSRRCSVGDLLIIRPFLSHEFRAPPGKCEHIAVHFDLSPTVPPLSSDVTRRAMYEVRLSDDLRLPEFLTARVGESAAVQTALAAIVKAWEDARPPGMLEARSQLLHVLVALLRVGTADEPAKLVSGEWRNRQRVERATRYIEEHFSERIDADDLASVAGLSVSQLTRLFRDRTGHPPMQYLRRLRIERARRLLADVDLSIKEIAGKCGFEDPYHFTRVFHQIDGLPPSLYREAVLAGSAGQNTGRNKP